MVIGFVPRRSVIIRVCEWAIGPIIRPAVLRSYKPRHPDRLISIELTSIQLQQLISAGDFEQAMERLRVVAIEGIHLTTLEARHGADMARVSLRRSILCDAIRSGADLFGARIHGTAHTL
ncbi:MAG: hypothetical protein ACI8RZ_000153 [Myxococcota bacterium]|jgi:uncharacterized protein YjbI with pentapeptide repeats